MAYLVCPDCRMPSPVADDAVKYRCMSCWTEIVFETCPNCDYQQAIPARWFGAYTCGHCEARCEIPRRRMYSTSTKAVTVKGYGHTFPKF